MQITEIPKYKLKKKINTNYKNTKIQITEIQITEIQIAGSQKYKLNKTSPIIQKSPIIHLLNMNYGWIWIMGEVYV